MVTCCRGGHVDAGMHVTSHQSRTRRANRGDASERSYDSDCKMQTGSCFTPPPSRRGFLQVRRSYIGPSSSDARVSTRTRPSSKAHPGPPVGREPATALPPPPRHPRPPPPPYIFITLYNNKRPLADAAALISFFSCFPLIARPGCLRTIPTARRRRSFSFLSVSGVSRTPLIRHAIHNNTNNNHNHILHSNKHDRGCIFFLIFLHSPPHSVCAGERGGGGGGAVCLVLTEEPKLYSLFILVFIPGGGASSAF